MVLAYSSSVATSEVKLIFVETSTVVRHRSIITQRLPLRTRELAILQISLKEDFILLLPKF